jgi:hypothetical protein
VDILRGKTSFSIQVPEQFKQSGEAIPYASISSYTPVHGQFKLRGGGTLSALTTYFMSVPGRFNRLGVVIPPVKTMSFISVHGQFKLHGVVIHCVSITVFSSLLELSNAGGASILLVLRS